MDHVPNQNLYAFELFHLIFDQMVLFIEKGLGKIKILSLSWI